ncbi:hypothetical protein PCL_12272 [Purpureocillium lilacinum]|uniref:Uncharacterized protein n=1 Tax=Purpureocillium lilacinum TaxID=33203 RepID=A0A2U3E8U0_PURLI|nr:hypothetical protein PCL_12272 [Purpureocillium lilacinum]
MRATDFLAITLLVQGGAAKTWADLANHTFRQPMYTGTLPPTPQMERLQANETIARLNRSRFGKCNPNTNACETTVWSVTTFDAAKGGWQFASRPYYEPCHSATPCDKTNPDNRHCIVGVWNSAADPHYRAINTIC